MTISVFPPVTNHPAKPQTNPANRTPSAIAEAYGQALAMTGDVIEKSGVDLHILDVGGGFPIAYPGQDAPPIDAYVAADDF